MTLAFECARPLRVLGRMMAAAAALLLPSLALAQDPAPSADPPPEGPAAPEPSRRINLTGSPTIDLSAPPPPERVDRKYHQHEGFYLRISGGLGSLLSASVDSGPFESNSDGVTLDLQALVGGSPAPGFAVGGGVIGSLQLSGDWELDDVVGSQSADLTSLIIGPFADGYPEPKGGWHMGGLLGLASVSFEAPGGDEGSDALGIGGAVWAGYDVWVGPEWSVGGDLRLQALRATNDDDDLTISSIGAVLSFSVLYN